MAAFARRSGGWRMGAGAPGAMRASALADDRLDRGDVANDDALASRFEVARVTPATQDARDRVEIRAAHLGEILSRNGERDADALRAAPGRMPDQPDEQAREALLDRLGGELAHLRHELGGAVADEIHRVAGDDRRGGDRLAHERGFPDEERRVGADRGRG